MWATNQKTRQAFAIQQGEVTAKTVLKDFIDDPSQFPNGSASLPSFVPRMASANLHMTLANPSKEEKELARESCEGLLRLVLDFTEAASQR